MKRLTLALGAVLFLLLLAPLAPATAKDKWTTVRSKNFILVGNASDKDIRQVATRLEQFRDVFTRLLNRTNFNSSVPTTVVVFKSHSNYAKFAPGGSTGYFVGGDDMNYIALSAEMGGENPYDTIFHEYVHLLVKNNFTTLPLWFNEGLAEYYSTFEIKDGERKVMIGKVISNHVLYLREQKFIPLQTLLNVDHRSPLYNESNKRGVFYAQSWALMHYLLLNQQRQPQLGRFLNLLIAGMSPEKAFPEAFQTDFATIEKELKEYIKRNTYPSQVATFERKLEFDLEMKSAPLSDAEGEYYMGDLLNHSGRFTEAEAHLKKAIELDPNFALAHASLGMMEMHKGNYAVAKKYLEKASATSTGNYLVHYYYAYVLSREAMDTGSLVYNYPQELAQKMRAELKKSIELNPSFPDSYRLLAFVYLVNNDQLDEAISLLKRAIELLPGEQEFGLLLARIYLRKEDYKQARELVEPIVRSSSTKTELRERAQSLLENINSREESMARYKAEAAGGGGTSRVIVEVGPDEKGNTRTPEEAMAAALEEALRKPQDGELRVRGQLLRIECGNKGIVFSIQTQGRLFKFTTSDFEGVDFTSFTPGMSGQINCGQRNPVDEVVVIYRPAKDAKSKADGQIVSVEFVPKEFKLKQ
jgi:tetratricopeptide (TPR) repeat protein